MPIPAIVPPLIAAGTSLGVNFLQGAQSKKAQQRQADANMNLARFQADANEKYLQQQLNYNLPVNEMRRFQDAGLNPHLIYGQGSPGNQNAPLSYPNIQPTDYQRNQGTVDFKSLMEALPLINQTRLANSQVQAMDAKTRQTAVLTELNKLQARVLEKNPLLDTEGFKAIIDSLKSTAEIKASESGIKQSQLFVQEASSGWQVQKIANEVELLEQRFKLSELDSRIKSEVLQSKEFQNAILEVQKKFMTDAQISPQHVLQFVQLLLMKIL